VKTLALFVVALAVALPVTVFVYLLTTQVTPNLFVDIGAAGFVCAVVVRLIARVPWRWSFAVPLALALVLALPTVKEALLPPAAFSDSGLAAALEPTMIPLKTVRAGSGFEDLEPLVPILTGRRIVALGEATHGTREFFQMKHRLLEFLVRRLGFRHYGMELSAPDGEQLDQFIHGKDVDLDRVLYWPWATEEVVEMLRWMQRFNASVPPEDQLTFHGIDPRSGDRDPVMAANVGKILASLSPDSGIVLGAANAHISNAPGWMGSYLKKEFGARAYLLGFEFNRGAFTSRSGAIHTFSAGPAPAHYYAHALARQPSPIVFLDVARLRGDPVTRRWIELDQSSHHFQELHVVFRLVPSWHTDRTSWTRLYDGLVFVRDTTPAVGLP
jgi:erythromycin esterase-like protein